MTVSSICFFCIVETIILLVSANGAPVLINKALGRRWAWPVDAGATLNDGRRLFGNTKTWRGLVSAILITATVATVFKIDFVIGALFGMFTMIGDMLASFIKRRLKRSESSRARGLDTIPESLLPVLFLQEPLALDLIDISIIVAVFFLIEEWVSPVLYRLHIKKRPY